MRPSIAAYLVVFVVAAVVSFVGTGVVRLLAPRIGAIVQPDERRVHARPTATLGGLGMFAGVVVAFTVAALLDEFDVVFEARSEVIGVLVAAGVITAVGVMDDIREVSAPARVAGMVFAGALLSLFGVSMLNLRVPLLDVFVLSPDWSALLTVLWVVGMANAINLIDGLDGLAAGIVAIAAGSFFLYSVELIDEAVLGPGNIGPLIAAVTAGACVGFLPHNWNPAQIFMGDTGALLLGLLMAASTISVGGRTSTSFTGQTYFFFLPIFIPLIILAVPILDTAFAIVRRASQGASLTSADKGHLHHRLMALGHGQKRSVAILWLWTALMSVFVLYPTYTGGSDVFAVIGTAALGLLLYTIFHPGARRSRREEPETETSDT